MSLIGYKALHFCIFFFGLHLAMNLADRILGEDFFYMLKSLFKILEVELLAFFYQWIHYVYLSSLLQLSANGLV